MTVLGDQGNEHEERVPFVQGARQQFYSGRVVSVKKAMPYPTAPTNPHGRTLKTSVLQIHFLSYKQNTFERALTVGNPQQPSCIQDTSKDRATNNSYFCLILGLAQ